MDDPYTKCLYCLYPKHDPKNCDICVTFSSKTLKDRERRLALVLLEESKSKDASKKKCMPGTSDEPSRPPDPAFKGQTSGRLQPGTSVKQKRSKGLDDGKKDLGFSVTKKLKVMLDPASDSGSGQKSVASSIKKSLPSDQVPSSEALTEKDKFS